MKKILYIILLTICYSCANNDVDSLFSDTPENRIALAQKEAKEILLSAPNGWKTYFGTTKTLGRWLILMKFDEKGKVQFKCDPVDYYYIKGVAYNDEISYKINYTHSTELVFESLSQFSAWNEFKIDTDGDGYLDRFATPETQFIFDKYEDGKLYMKGKSNIGNGKRADEIYTYVFEKASESDWDISGIAKVKKAIGYDDKKGKYQRLSNNNELLESLFMIDSDNRLVLYKSMGKTNDAISMLPFYVTNEGFALVNPLEIPNVGTIREFNVNTVNGSIVSANIPSLSVVYTDKKPAVVRTPFSVFNRMYLGIEVYHSTGEPIGRNLKKFFDDLRPPYAPEEQHLNVIYFAKNIDKDMGQKAFKYDQELTLIYADTDPSYSDKDLYGKNATLVHIPVQFETSSTRMWVISLAGSIEKAFIDAYPTRVEYAKQKATEAIPMITKLLSEKGWGLYAQNTNTQNPTVQVIDEDDIAGSFFTLYPYTQEDVNRAGRQK